MQKQQKNNNKSVKTTENINKSQVIKTTPKTQKTSTKSNKTELLQKATEADFKLKNTAPKRKEKTREQKEIVLKSKKDTKKQDKVDISADEIPKDEVDGFLNKSEIKDKKVKNVKVKKETSDLKGLIILGLFVLMSVVLEIVNYLYLGFGVLPIYFMYMFGALFIMFGLLFLIPSNVARLIVATIILLLQGACNVVNYTLYTITGKIFHLSILKLVATGAESFTFQFVNVPMVIINGILVLSYLAVAITTEKYLVVRENSKSKKRLPVIFSIIFALEIVGFSFLFVTEKLKDDDFESSYSYYEDGSKYLWNGMYTKNITFKKYGTFAFYFKDLLSELGKNKELTKAEYNEVEAAIENGLVTSGFSNIAEGDNLIMILLESFDSFAIDPYNTPNLWNLTHGEGVYFDNFHGYNYTNDSEMVSYLGHNTYQSRLLDYNKAVGLSMPYSLPNLLKNQGYENVNFFHSYNKTFYARNEMNKIFGFDEVYGLEDCTLENKSKEFGDWILDSDYIQNMMDKFIPAEGKFLSYFATVSTHGPFTTYNERVQDNFKIYDENKEKFKTYLDSIGYNYPEDEDLEAKFRQYKAFTIDTDKAVGLMINRLKELEILDTTTILLFADHNQYYDNMANEIKGIGKSNYWSGNLHRIPLIIYNDEISPQINHTFCSTYDIYPTLCSMMGLEYNSALVQGKDIFGDDIDSTVFVSFKRGIFNNDYWSEDLIDTILLGNNPQTTELEFKLAGMEFYKKQTIIENYYKINYYKNK